ncbi:pseudouridine synthase [Roseburia sp. MSJ-14]|uniref:pseudouridine synthase n=1 Tax=Roseburia sp. MSJ-14 TaxID=2841514 RepID=UPI001C0F8DEB|nr:pseudouridine synthase [Roseburia sp. MSJ-14]MBU5472586.1 pseudouridine synthase [Roseburia sp. MSJ-14]
MTEPVRINKYLSEAGVCSRREADRQIEAGHVTINGRKAVMGDKVSPGDEVYFGKKKVSKEEEIILLAVNKPRGIVCTAEKRERNNIVDFVNYPKRIYPIGRLDKESRGLILMTNQGELVNKMMRSGNRHEKEYIVRVNRDITRDFLEKMSAGVYLEELDATTRKCKVEQLGKRTFRIVLTQGMNRQIRRMCEKFHYRVVDLKRTRIMNIQLGDLKEGASRRISPEEWKELRELIKDSSNETVIPTWQ